MDLNININFRVEQQTLDAITSVASSMSESGLLHRAEALVSAAFKDPSLATYIKKVCEESGEQVKEEPASETVLQDVTAAPDSSSDTASDAPAEPQPEKPKRVRRIKAQPAEQHPEEAPATPEEASANPEEAPATTSEQSDLPFSVDEEPVKAEIPTLSIDGFRQKLDAIRDTLGLNDGQPNAALKREFTKLARELMPYYGGDKSDMLTPANLYWYAEQLSRISLDDNNEFTRPKPAITPGQVEELKKAPF